MKKHRFITAASVITLMCAGQVFSAHAEQPKHKSALSSKLPADFTDQSHVDDIEKHIPKNAPAPRKKPNPRRQKNELKKAKAMLKEIKLSPPIQTMRTLPGSHPLFGISVEGFRGSRKGNYDSMFRVTDVSNDDIVSPTTTLLSRTTLSNFNASWGWAVDLDYQFTKGSDVFFSYRNSQEKTDLTSNVYSSLGSIEANIISGTYYRNSGDWNFIYSDGYSIGGSAGLGKTFSYLVATDTLTEQGEFSYQQANVGWGHLFSLTSSFHIHPYLGLAWRHIGYKDRMTFTSIGARSGGAPVSGTDYIATGTTVTSHQTILTLDGENVQELQHGDMQVDIGGSGTVYFSKTSTAADTYYLVDNSAYDTTLSTLLPSYTSKFSGVGPKLGFDTSFSLGSHVSFRTGIAMAMPYAKLKTHGYTTDFTIRDIQSGGNHINSTTGSYLQTNVNLQAESGDRAAFSFSSHKIIPEMELNIGLRFTAHTKQQSRAGGYLDKSMPENASDCYFEIGYRAIKDWSAVENIDLATETLTGARNVTNQGVYLKAGVDF